MKFKNKNFDISYYLKKGPKITFLFSLSLELFKERLSKY